MKALHCWLLTEGAHGMISQVEGLANSLNTTFDHQTIKLSSFFKLLPPSLTPKSEGVFNFNELMKNNKNYPDLLISCGRKSVVPSIVIKKYLKSNFKNNIKNIHIQDPKVSPKNFDAIITPKHDNVIHSDNIIQSVGALHYLNESEVINQNGGEVIVTFILGGPNKYYKFDKKDLETHFSLLDRIKEIKKINVIASRRTPKSIFDHFHLKYNNNKFNFDFSLNKRNYTNAYSEASHILVTCDSTSMISEAAITGKPLYVVKLSSFKNDYRFKKFLENFKELGIIRIFEGTLEHWTYEKLYESKRVANKIVEKLKLYS